MRMVWHRNCGPSAAGLGGFALGGVVGGIGNGGIGGGGIVPVFAAATACCAMGCIMCCNCNNDATSGQ